MNRITFVLGLGVFGVICTEFGVIGILPHLARHFQIGIEKTGLLISLFSLIIAVSGIFITLFISRFNKRYVLLFSLFVFVVSNVLSAIAISFEWLLFARLIPAFFVPIYFSTALVTATETAKAAKSAEAAAFGNGLLISTANFGVAIGTTLGDFVIDRYGIHHLTWAGLVLFFLTFVTFRVKQIIQHPVRHTSSWRQKV